MNNWVLNRVGLINFWYYQNQIFEFAKGHMLLRGTNGSGKSLTMQSLFPVLFDGDTSAYRLDSFGSRDRKMEDYLLGEKGVSDRDDGTGYLFLEVKRSNRQEYLTIGIGLSVTSRGSRLNKWFFALENNQRIGIDMDLFEMPRADEIQPLSKKKLKNRLEGKGRVFETQKEYKQYVSDHMFGFENIEQFDELIVLLINLRSPKLSKEYRPSVIYGILRDSLPKLKEDDLLSLSRTIEQLDGHRERLEDLQNETRELTRFSKVYQELTSELTGQVATHWYETYVEKNHLEKIQQQLTKEVNQLQQNIKENQEQTTANGLRLEVIEKSIQELNQHEGFHLVARGQELKEQVQKLLQQISGKQEQLQRKQESLRNYQAQQEQYQLEQDAAQQEFEDLLDDNQQYLSILGLESLDQQYTKKLREQPSEKDIRYWKSEISKKKQHYEIVIQQQEKIAALTDEVTRLGRELGDKQQAIDEIAREIRHWQQVQMTEIENWKIAIDSWRQSTSFSIAEEDYNQLLFLMDRLAEEELPEHEIAEPIHHSFQQALLENQRQRIPVVNRQAELKEQAQEKKAEIRNWQIQKTPEPERTDGRIANRQELTTAYIPFYQAVDFKKEIDQQLGNKIEGALYASGILDSLIAKEGLTVNEDVQILPNPQFFTTTLADILDIIPDTPQELQSVVADVLQSIVLDEVLEGVPMISQDGSYQIANLKGAAPRNYQASYIGATNQERYRQQRIAALEEELQAIAIEQEQLKEKLQQLQLAEEKIHKDYQNLPKGTEVYQAIRYAKEKQFEKTEAETSFARLKQQMETLDLQLNNLKVQLHERTTQDTFKSTVEGYEMALTYIKNYAANVEDAYACSKDIENRHLLIQQNRSYIEGQEEETTIFIHDLTDLDYEKTKYEGLLQDNLEQQKLVDVADLQQRLAQNKAELRQRKEAQEAHAQQEISLVREESSKTTQLETVAEQQKDLVFREQHWRALLQVKSGLSYEDLLSFAKNEKRELNSKRAKDLESRVISQFNFLADQLQTYQPQLLSRTGIELDNQSEQEIGEFGNFNHYKEANFQFEGQKLNVMDLLTQLNEQQITLKELLKKDDERLFKRVILESVGTILRKKIETAMLWVKQMNDLLQDQKNSSGLSLSIVWKPLSSMSEKDLGTKQLVSLLQKQTELLREEDREAIARHFQEKVYYAQEQVQQNPDERNTLFQAIAQVLDYRDWFEFELRFRRANESYQTQVLTDRKFNQFSGGEKAIAMYLPLFTAVASRYRDANPECPKVITLDEAFAGIDDTNIGELFKACEQLEFNYVMNSQALFGDYPTVSALMVYELLRPQNINLVTPICYYWNGFRKEMRIGADTNVSE
jgi:uncharacterized protein (TIGR02680 family)